jgi:hypothetical protein
MAYANTDHLFSQPVRYYKANDPYYYEVDNIPIRQLEENILWVKDQIDSMITPASGAEPAPGGPLFVGDDLDLENVKQLRPKFAGGRTINVQAGKFMARINDAYGVADSLAQLTATFLGNSCANLPIISQNNTTAFFDAIWESYTQKLSTATFTSCVGESNEAAAYRANGLETMFTFYISKNWGNPIDTLLDSTYGAPEYAPGDGRGETWPALWHSDIKNIIGVVSRTNWNRLNELHVKVVQHWRGVIRTSLVDFRGESIDIPPFASLDYFYVNDAGENVSLQDLATQRIDLLVVYTHPIDASGSTLSEYSDVETTPGIRSVGTPKSITNPQLGIIRGAGIGIKRTNDQNIEVMDKTMYPGEQKILANLNDHTDGGSNTGIKLKNGSIIHGSFPSPDDLVNIAPNLTLALADNNLQLIGQTALPIAYIVVNKDSTNLTQEDIIDIRPFFRTTELSYNERAGVAGAQPALSFANPAVGAAQLEAAIKCVENQITPHSVIPPSVAASPVTISYTDAIMGGLCFGAEGTLCMMNTQSDGPMGQTAGTGNIQWTNSLGVSDRRTYLFGLYDAQTAKGGNFQVSEWCADVENGVGTRGRYLGLPYDREIPFFPEWEMQISDETTTTEIQQLNRGVPTDWINWADAQEQVKYTPPGMDAAGFINFQINRVPFLKKTLRFKVPPQIAGYDVKAEFANCIPLNPENASHDDLNPTNTLQAGATGVGGVFQGGGNFPAAIRYSNTPGSGDIFIFKSGLFLDSDGNRVAEVDFVVPTIPIFNNDDDRNVMMWLVWAQYAQAVTNRNNQAVIGGAVTLNSGFLETSQNQYTQIATIGAPGIGLRGSRFPEQPRPRVGIAAFPSISFTFTGTASNNSGDPIASGSEGTSVIAADSGIFGTGALASGATPPWSSTPTLIDLTGV